MKYGSITRNATTYNTVMCNIILLHTICWEFSIKSMYVYISWFITAHIWCRMAFVLLNAKHFFVNFCDFERIYLSISLAAYAFVLSWLFR